MKPIRNLFLALAATCLSAVAADPALLRMLPQDSMFIAGVNAEQIKTSRFGQFVLDQLKSEEQSMNNFISMTGFDPRRDLQELIVASSDARSHGKMLVVARGRFDASKIASFAASHGVKSQSYAGVEIMTHSQGKSKDGWLAVLDNSTALAGDEELVKAAIDRRKTAGTPQISQATATKITDLSMRYDAWMISASLARLADDFKSPQVGGAMNGNFMQGMENVMGGVRFGATVELMAEATMRSEKDAQAMVDVVKFLTGMMQLNSEDPKAAEFARLTEKMDLKATGTQFKLSMMIPEDVLEGILKPAARVVRKKASPVL